MAPIHITHRWTAVQQDDDGARVPKAIRDWSMRTTPPLTVQNISNFPFDHSSCSSGKKAVQYPPILFFWDWDWGLGLCDECIAENGDFCGKRQLGPMSHLSQGGLDLSQTGQKMYPRESRGRLTPFSLSLSPSPFHVSEVDPMQR